MQRLTINFKLRISYLTINDDASNNSENNCDGEEIEDSPVSVNVAYYSMQTLRKSKSVDVSKK
ncbi:hypothetical protein T10_11930 [Trichinella papuae]|uniref:Uncharacterized protein n=1 Tax=Trichinella papuae TaxID=268474 RepID=A0A0V1MMV7_9BILA|nr:hypothetical protein T10_11930 [Trichinella papuae]